MFDTRSKNTITEIEGLEANSIDAKIERYRRGKKLRVLDLFSGCGGLSLGFQKAGYDIIAAVELDKNASKSHSMNFHPNSTVADEHSKSRDIHQTDPKKFFDELELEGRVQDQIDIIIGGPPCQAFTRVGRAKLREVKSDSNAFLNDSRSQLYKRYLEYVRKLKPIAILMENVPDILNYGGINIADIVCEDLESQGYQCKYTLLNSVYYGVPQMRERMFLIATHKSVGCQIAFPEPTHYTALPAGYHGSRNVALKHINPRTNSFYVQAPKAKTNLQSAVTVKQALSDLPKMTKHLRNQPSRRSQDLNEELGYNTSSKNGYQTLMRSWCQRNERTKVSSNVIRSLPRDYPIFRRMKEGDQYPEALLVAKKIFNSRLRKEERYLKRVIDISSAKYKQLLKEIVPPYDESKFPNKWRKMEANKPARTLMAHLGKDSYSHIHYDGEQARTISVREAARLQSFPDGFQFSGSMNAAFRQIGNAVPPLLAFQIATKIKSLISES